MMQLKDKEAEVKNLKTQSVWAQVGEKERDVESAQQRVTELEQRLQKSLGKIDEVGVETMVMGDVV